MDGTEAVGETSLDATKAPIGDMKLEVLVIPVADADRAKHFYGALGWRLDLDFTENEHYRVIQFTPPGSGCSIIFGKGLTPATPGSAQGLYLAVSDIEASRAALIERGVAVGETFHDAGGIFYHVVSGKDRVSGLAPERWSYGSYASFSDPDGNGWLLQEITTRSPSPQVVAAFQRTANEKRGSAPG